uniref:Uncharacterized protein n=1 Tax=Nelumbo nucifera TaxID=4432 RepID=A0A822Z8V8_NELNU|nr:TPA_asm: hypothetical protein HUJ06_015343 [Nelumbo nucifera]
MIKSSSLLLRCILMFGMEIIMQVEEVEKDVEALIEPVQALASMAANEDGEEKASTEPVRTLASVATKEDDESTK